MYESTSDLHFGSRGGAVCLAAVIPGVSDGGVPDHQLCLVLDNAHLILWALPDQMAVLQPTNCDVCLGDLTAQLCVLARDCFDVQQIPEDVHRFFYRAEDAFKVYTENTIDFNLIEDQILTFDKKHGPTRQVFYCEDYVSRVGQQCFFDRQPILAAVADHLDAAVSSHDLAVYGPARLIINIVGEVAFEGASLAFQDRQCLQPLNNSDV